MKLEIVCSSCGNNFLKDEAEIKRQKKNKGENTPFYCSLKCFGKSKIVIPEIINKTCKCGIDFKTSTGATYCCLRCASLYSLTEERLSKMLIAGENTRITSDNLVTVSNSLRVREWAKYDLLHHYLLTCAISHSFEYCLENSRHIFDLALHDLFILIEFDEEYHFKKRRKENDEQKDISANNQGWTVVRIDVRSATIPYSVDLIKNLLVSYE